MGKKPSVEDHGSVTIRMPAPMLERLDAYVAGQIKSRMGSPYTRSDAIRDALFEMFKNEETPKKRAS